jgi:hypothetical protein
VAVSSLLCPVVVVEMVLLTDERRKEIGSAEPPELSYT